MCTQYTSSEVTPNWRIQLQPSFAPYRVHRNATETISNSTPTLVSTCAGLSSQKSDLLYRVKEEFAKYWHVRISIPPSSAAHCMQRSVASGGIERITLPALTPKARYAPHGKMPNAL